MNIFDELKKDAQAFDNVLIKGEQEVKSWAEQVFGKDKADQAILNATTVAQTALGKLAKKAAVIVESELTTAVAGTTRLQAAVAIVKALAAAMGFSFDLSAINSAIEVFVPFLASKALAGLAK